MERRIIRIIAIFFAATLGLSGLAYASSHDTTDDAPAVEVEDETQDTDEGSSDDDSTEEGSESGDETEGDESEEDGTEEEGTEEDGAQEEDETETDGTEDTAENGDDEGSEDEGETTESEPVVHGVERSTDGCPEGTFRNHGAYVSSTDERPRSAAAKSNCGKPAHAGKGNK